MEELKRFEDYVPQKPKIVSARTGKTTVAIVGFAKSTRDQTPFEDTQTEIWGLNEAYKYPWMKRWTRWFQLHPIWDYMRANNRNDANHALWLQEEHDFPIYLQHVDPLVPASVRYPIEAVIRNTGSIYYTSTIAYLIAFALLEGFERIEVYGVEMSAGTEYAYQRAGCEYYLGMARGRGVEVYLPNTCQLLRGNLYGYEDIRLSDRTWMELRRKTLGKMEEEHLDDLKKAKGRLEEATAALHQASQDGLSEDMRMWLAKRLNTRLEEEKTRVITTSAINGAKVEMDNFIRWHDVQNIPNDRQQLLRLVDKEPEVDTRIVEDSQPQELKYEWKEGPNEEEETLSGETVST